MTGEGTGRGVRGERTVACPICGQPAVFGPSNRYRPFCGERCRMVDLGGWASERYRIPSRPDEGERDDEAEGGGGGRD